MHSSSTPVTLSTIELDELPFDPVLRMSDTIVLMSLQPGPSYSYALEQQINQLSWGRILTGTGAIHKALRRLERDGFVSEVGLDGRKRYFDITIDGRKQLSRNLLLMRRIIAAIDGRRIFNLG